MEDHENEDQGKSIRLQNDLQLINSVCKENSPMYYELFACLCICHFSNSSKLNKPSGIIKKNKEFKFKID